MSGGRVGQVDSRDLQSSTRRHSTSRRTWQGTAGQGRAVQGTMELDWAENGRSDPARVENSKKNGRLDPVGAEVIRKSGKENNIKF